MKGSLTSWLAEIDPVNGRDILSRSIVYQPPSHNQMKSDKGGIQSSGLLHMLL